MVYLINEVDRDLSDVCWALSHLRGICPMHFLHRLFISLLMQYLVFYLPFATMCTTNVALVLMETFT